MKNYIDLILSNRTFPILILTTVALFSHVVCAELKTQVSLKQSVSKQPVTKKATLPLSSVDEEVQKQLEKDWGIRIVGLRTTMKGLMVDLRYKIVDARKASPLLDINKKAYLLVEKNQARLGVPSAKKVGALRQTTHAKKVKEGRDYFILFGNPGARYIKPGDKATLVIGDLKLEHLTLL